ncbi:hypothetical protein [Gilvimarinus polysaccharolyticus]|uniref:hypothetical protein n=1 Tax=Gilvimarinus polysaccharolyticus TaxID=863921 RepID=UPI0006738032|nr:hypothetical protein [Gilvimarinus polysaccharolyticus]
MKFLLVVAAYLVALISLYLQSQIEYSSSISSIQGVAVAACTFLALVYLFTGRAISCALLFIPAYVFAAWSGSKTLYAAGYGIAVALGGG